MIQKDTAGPSPAIHAGVTLLACPRCPCGEPAAYKRVGIGWFCSRNCELQYGLPPSRF